ncbi:MAG: LysR family transcriptional regulator [Firmicutes bacterium]|jgi:DNA-binding transcriptional LysR family regulator|nr:LysR family transcriptional regulator [Bacillota bacterium]MCL5012923.1 LysR family transcriptional regulator [Bacillota bacterium]
MNDEVLKSFRVVATAGSLSRAAQILRLSQPTISRHVQQLEEEVGTSLLDRSSHPLVLTPAGAMILEFAGRTLTDWNTLKQSFSSPPFITSSIEIASSTVPAKVLVLPAVARFLRDYPSISVHVSVMNSQKVIQAVQRETVDVGFAGMKPDEPSWRIEVIGQDEVCLIVPDRLPYRKWPQNIPLHQLEKLAVVERREGSGTQLTAYNMLRERGIAPRFHVVCEVDSHEELIEAVATGIGVGFASRQVVARTCQPQIKTVRLQGGPIVRDLYALSKQLVKDGSPTALLLSYVRMQNSVMDGM